MKNNKYKNIIYFNKYKVKPIYFLKIMINKLKNILLNLMMNT